jgi:glucose-6-phosphate 1-epimerase
MTIAELNEKYRIQGEVEFSTGAGGLPVIVISNQFATALIFLHGAHIVSFQPKGEKDLLWMSEESVFEEGKPIRGGMPICFPWFGPHATDTLLPQHGFARLSNWEVATVVTLENGASQIELLLHHSPATKALWPFEFSAKLTVTVSAKLEVKLSITNTGDKTFTYSDALHTYLNISDISSISIDGLGSAVYYDGFGTEPKKQDELLLVIAKEENRRYVGHTANCIIYDKGFTRKLRVSKTGSKVTVVWNPGAETSKKIADMQDDGYKTFICVEAVNAYDNVITLTPNEQFAISTTISAD